MDKRWIEAAQREGRRVGVVVGQIAAEVNPGECAPLVLPARVWSQAQKQPNSWWLGVEFLPGDSAPLPQLYREEDILGLWGVQDAKP